MTTVIKESHDVDGVGLKVKQYADNNKIDVKEARVRMFFKLENFAKTMDSAVQLPVIGGVGLDPVLGFFPILGDVVSKLFSVSIIVNAAHLGTPKPMILKMVKNSFLDLCIGSVPIVGDVFDVFFRANKKNVGMLKSHLIQNNILTDSNAKGTDPKKSLA